jgi:hypothetical protein
MQTPLRNLEAEIARLRGLYRTSVLSYGRTQRELRKEMYAEGYDRDVPVLADPNDPDSVIANNAYAFLNRMNSQFPRYLRETIFVRLISALEVFIVNVTRELFLHRRDMFHTNEKIEGSSRDTQQSAHNNPLTVGKLDSLGGLAAEFPHDWLTDSMTQSTSITIRMQPTERLSTQRLWRYERIEQQLLGSGAYESSSSRACWLSLNRLGRTTPR